MSAACASSRLIWKFPSHAPTCAIVGDSQTKYLHKNFDPSSPHSPAFITLPGAGIRDVVNLLDFVPRGVTELILHVGTNDVANTNGQVAKERYSNLLDHIAKERPDIQATFVTLVLPRSPNRRRNPHDWSAAARFNREADAFNCLLVELCENREKVFFLHHCLHHFPPKMVLAADGLHPSFGGVSIMAWNLYTFLLELRRPRFADWQDYASPSPARETQQEPTFAQATLQTEPSRHLDLDWPPLTHVTSPNPATGPHPHNSLDATPAGGATAIPETPAPQPEVLPPRRPRKQSASPEAHQVDPTPGPESPFLRLRRRRCSSPGPTAELRRGNGRTSPKLPTTSTPQTTPQQPLSRIAPQDRAALHTLSTGDSEDAVKTPAPRYNLRKCPGSARRVQSD